MYKWILTENCFAGEGRLKILSVKIHLQVKMLHKIITPTQVFLFYVVNFILFVCLSNLTGSMTRRKIIT